MDYWDELDYWDEEEEYQLSVWPAYLIRALSIYHGGYFPPDEIEKRVARWGGLEFETLVRALATSDRDEREVILRVLGESDAIEISDFLRPLLNSENSKERWLSAIYLGVRHQPEAIPVLLTMLTEFWPSSQAPQIHEDSMWFASRRATAASILDAWETPLLEETLVPAIRHALLKSIETEPFFIQANRPALLEKIYLRQDRLFEMLGKRGAFGAVAGISLPPHRFRRGIMRMAMKYCRMDPLAYFLSNEWETNPVFRECLLTTLRQRFGLSEQEQQFYLDSYSNDQMDREDFQGIDFPKKS